MESIEQQAAEASGRRARSGPSYPAVTAKDPSGPSPVQEAFDYASDRNERLAVMIGQLDDIVDRAWRVLQDVIPGDEAQKALLPTEGGVAAKVSQINERQSTIARRVNMLGEHSDESADRISHHTRRLEALLDAVQL